MGPGETIEEESFRIIRSEMGSHHLDAAAERVVVRVIHATADFEFLQTLRFHPEAVSAGVRALRLGGSVVSDVHMVEVGISRPLLGRLHGKTHCAIADETVKRRAQTEGITRAQAAMRELSGEMNGAIVAIGNAPTALFEVLRLVRRREISPALVVGVPVGFVGAESSKEELIALDWPHIAARGRKGGSSVAVAIVNALLRMAVGDGAF